MFVESAVVVECVVFVKYAVWVDSVECVVFFKFAVLVDFVESVKCDVFEDPRAKFDLLAESVVQVRFVFATSVIEVQCWKCGLKSGEQLDIPLKNNN